MSTVYTVGLLEFNGVAKPCPNCYIAGKFPRSGCVSRQYEVDQMDMYGWYGDGEYSGKPTFFTTTLTAEEIQEEWPTLDFANLQPGDRVVGRVADKDGVDKPCSNCYHYNFPCGNCAQFRCDEWDWKENDHELEDCSKCREKGREWTRRCQIVRYDDIKGLRENYPERYEDFVKLSFEENQRWIAVACDEREAAVKTEREKGGSDTTSPCRAVWPLHPLAGPELVSKE